MKYWPSLLAAAVATVILFVQLFYVFLDIRLSQYEWYQHYQNFTAKIKKAKNPVSVDACFLIFSCMKDAKPDGNSFWYKMLYNRANKKLYKAYRNYYKYAVK